MAPYGGGVSTRKLTSLVPIATWIRTYDRRWLRGDLIAGVTVAALIVPKNLGYAGIAGIPLQNGLYAAAAGALLYAIFGTSRQISMGPSSGLAAVAASAVIAAGLTDETDVASFVAGITLASGVVFVLLAVLKMGWIAQFLSRAVVTGLPVRSGHRRGDRRAAQADRHRRRGHQLAPGAVVLARHARRDPAGDGRRRSDRTRRRLRAAAGRAVRSRARWCWSSVVCWRRGCSTSATTAWRSSATCPVGCPSFDLPDGSLMWDHVDGGGAAAVALVLIGFSQTAGDARAFAAKHRYQIDIDQESVAQAPRTSGRASSRACRSRRACRRARSTTTRAPAAAWRRSPPA